jgi:putative ATP-dependent endonuclease of the OLD family
MKLRRVSVENVRSFLQKQELRLDDGDISILIGPNGGGKTNLLDTAVLALRIFLLTSWIPRHNPTPDWQERYDWMGNDTLTADKLEKHSDGQSLTQSIEIDVEVTAPDIENIKRTKAEAAFMEERSKSKYTSFPASVAVNWTTEDLVAGNVFTYRIQDGLLMSPSTPPAEIFRQYLNTYELNSRLREDFGQQALSTPMIFLPVNRSAGTVSSSISLADFDEYSHKKTVDAASSRNGGSIASLAIGRLAINFRELLECDNGQARTDLKADPALKGFTEELESLGYSWDLKCVNTRRNQYDIQLTKQNSSFRVGSASSGERELLTYLFAIYVLNVRDALIVIDEPELHLHPRWQRTLLKMFEKLSRKTGNQFIMATHSPVFVSPSSIQYVSRVYSENQQSKIVRLGDSDLPEPKHLFGIVNSQNNERIFFADLVILVEGISDRIFFEAIFQHFKVGEGSGKVYEVVSVGGKMLFSQYERLLQSSRIKYIIIADRDYLQQIGNDEIKSLFAVSANQIHKNVIKDPTSIDASSLIDRLDEAIKSGVTEDLSQLWEYIKSRQTRLRDNLNEAEDTLLNKFILEQRPQGKFVLSKGSLEDYLPVGHKGKDVEKLIRLVSAEGMWELLPAVPRAELQDIVSSIHLS